MQVNQSRRVTKYHNLGLNTARHPEFETKSRPLTRASKMSGASKISKIKTLATDMNTVKNLNEVFNSDAVSRVFTPV